MSPNSSTTGRLLIAATPLGNLGDATDRLKDALASADIVAAEDTRRALRLAHDLGITIEGRVLSFYEAVEAERATLLIDAVMNGQTVLVITDAGMPAVSDPGYRLVLAAIAADVPMVALPGPSAALTALVLSGLPTDRFCFEGFLPRKGKERTARLATIATDARTSIIFESPRRTAATLTDLADVCGLDRAACVARELTKTYEEFVRGSLGELREWAASKEVLGEITIVVGGAPERAVIAADDAAGMADLGAQVAALIATGLTRRDAVDAVAATSGQQRKVVYAASLATRS